MPALNRGRATMNGFDVAIKHQRKVVISAVVAHATKLKWRRIAG